MQTGDMGPMLFSLLLDNDDHVDPTHATKPMINNIMY